MSSWFNLRRALALFRVESRLLLSDRSALVLIFGLPVMQIALYGYGVSFIPQHVPVAFATNDAAMSLQAPALFEHDSVVRMTGAIGVLGDAERAIRQGDALVGIEIAKPKDDQPRRVSIFVDGSDPATVGPVLAGLNVFFWRRAAQYYADEQAPVITQRWLYGDPERPTWAVSPGLVGVVVMVTMLFLGAMCLVRERERGTWESLLATPIRPAEALAGKLLPYLLIGIVETVLLLGFVHLLFDVPLPPGSLALVAAAPLFAGSYLLLGFVFSALAQTQLQAVQGAVAVYLPSLLLSGFLFPFSGMPGWAQAIGSVLPLTHYLRASRDILLRGASAGSIWSHLLPIAAFTLGTTVVAVFAFRRRLD
ncbi:MAG TPA: ABC transporter permease [Steroidobacteraceae bacterium]|nr:ABC transporter permease [Steroidobacteraceae bacterium]